MIQHREIRLSGSGGQGLQLSARILAQVFINTGAHVAQSQSYEPTSRGGMSRSDLVIDEGTPDYPLAASLDILLILDECAAGASEDILGKDALVLVDSERVKTPPKSGMALPLTRKARELGNIRVANIIALGAINAFAGFCSENELESAVRSSVPARFLDLNLEALAAGYELAGAKEDLQQA